MARPLRVLVAGGWYHVTNRGQRREALFRNDGDRRRFLGRLAELPERFRVEVHAFVLMDNHYHVLLRTLDPNLSHAMRWVQVAYSATFNWAHRLHGHVFQGRFKAVHIQKESDISEVARYLHLNPVRIQGLGLGKAEQRQARVAGGKDPGGELVARRLETLESFQWSSWRVYGGAEPPPGWLETSMIDRACGGRSRGERLAALRRYTEAPVRQGRLERPWDRLVGGLVLGDVDYAQMLLRGIRTEPAEQTEARKMVRSGRRSWKEIVQMVETLTDRTWDSIVEAHGDWIRDGAIYVAIRFGGYRLAEVQQQIPGLKYPAAAQAVRRFKTGLENDPSRQRFVAGLRGKIQERE